MTNQIFNSYQLDGSLVSKDESSGDLKLLEYFGAKDNILGNNTDNTVTSRSNKVSINSLLKAAKASLDENTRKNGLVLTVYIDYQNQSNIFAKNKKVLYSYQVEVASGMKADRVEVVPTSAQTVTEIRRKGIRIIFQQTGSFGQFSFVTLLIYLCIILLLSAIATLLLEMLMIYVLPQRYLYYARKYDLYNGVKEARPTGMVALDDDASFYTAHQSAMLASAIALNGCVSPAQARHMSLLRVMNPTDRSIESSLSSRSYSEPRRRTTSLPSTMRQVHNEAVPSEPPSYFSRNSQSYGHLTPMDRVSENSENQQTSSTLSKAPTHPHYTITNNLAESNKNSQSSDNEEDLSMVSIALDDATPPPRVNYAQQQNMPRASLEQTRLPPIYLVDTSQTTSTLPCETRQDLSCSYGSSTDQSLANQASVAPSSMLSRSHQPQGHAPALLPASARIYRYEPESSRNSWTSNAPITPHAYRSKPRAIDTSSITSNVITSFIREPEEALVEDPSNVLSDNTIMSYFSANATQISIPDVVVEDTEGEEMPEILLSFNPLLNQSVETGYMAADDNEHEDISNEFTSEYESRDESSGADTSTPAPTTNRSFSDSDTCLANAIYAMEMLGSDSSFIVEQI
ncbi:hypothetical protein BDF19DRAFT_137 [Syncephalis fuscata]|nr:hypothetical protein BDF19DRAFT_137 [Syncephalis fuscata]